MYYRKEVLRPTKHHIRQLSFVIVLLAIAICSSSAIAQDDDSMVRAKIYSILRDSLVYSLGAGRSNGDVVAYRDVFSIADTTLTLKANLLSMDIMIVDGNHKDLLYSVKQETIDRISKNRKLLRINSIQIRDEVNKYLVEILDETEGRGISEAIAKSKYSYYRFLLGGSWVHTKEKATEGKVHAALLARTRLAGDLSDKGSFLDLLIDAQFITNESFNDVSITDTVSVALLNSAKSSKLSMGLFGAVKNIPIINTAFADDGVIGLILKFSISTRENSDDIFRRFETGIRLENRSNTTFRGAVAEVAFTVDNAPGTLQEKSNKFGFKRIILNMELPMVNEKKIGLYASFHGEWSIGSKEKIDGSGPNGESIDKFAPLYEFRFGTTVDPSMIFGKIFNFN
ncbi:MAG: hypothetical protein GY839_17770 [candidate division Zixibacteria bacterium]|nr:hypothetical protein [candidate division Zixibacteria bacterium]